MSNNITINVNIKIKEERKCSVCGALGHNKRTCSKVDKSSICDDSSSVDSATSSKIKETITPWHPNMFKGHGVFKMPTLVGWVPGINSLELLEDMKKNPFYTYDDDVKAWRKI